MRSMRWVMPIAAAVLAVGAGVSGAEPGDSLVAGEESVPADSVAVVDTEPGEANENRDQTVYRIQLEGGESVDAVRVETAWSDFVRYRRPDGTMGYVPAHRIVHIYDANGSDLRDIVLKHRHPLGGGEAETRKIRSFAFQGGDKTYCNSFLILEAGWLASLKDPNGDGSVLSGDLGFMTNVGSRSAIGGSAFAENGSGADRRGIRLRYRRWITHRTSLELSPGIIVNGNEQVRPPGFVGAVALNGGDLASLVLEGEVARYQSYGYYYDGAGNFVSTSTRRTGTALRVGVRGGSYVGAGAVVISAVLLAIFVAALARYD